MWDVLVRRNGVLAPLPNLPPFFRREMAEQFAADFAAGSSSRPPIRPIDIWICEVAETIGRSNALTVEKAV